MIHGRWFKANNPNLIPFLAASLAFGCLLLIFWQAGRWYQAHLISERRAQVLAELTPYANALTSTINRRFALLRGVQAFIEANLSNELTASEFERFAAGLYADTRGIRNFSAAPNGVQRYVYPLPGNENVLNHDLIHDERPNVRADVERTIQTGQIALSGPYELRQGGLGLIARLAVYPHDEDRFWGLVAMVLDVPPILEEAGLEPGPAELDFALRDGTGQVFFGQPALFEIDPIIYPIELPDGAWELAAVPTGGWVSVIPDRFLLFQAAGLVIVVLGSTLVYLVINRQSRLEAAVQKRTQEINQINIELEQELSNRRQAEATLQRHAERLHILREIDQAILVAQSPQDIAQAALGHIRRLVPCERVSVAIFEYDSGQATLLATDANSGITFIGETHRSLMAYEPMMVELRQGQVNVRTDLAALSPLSPPEEMLLEAGIRSYLNVPLLVKDQLIGSLNLEAGAPNFFVPEFIDIACEVANPLAVAITQAHLQHQIRQHTDNLEKLVANRTRELSVLYDVTAVASQPLDLTTTLRRALERVMVAINCGGGAIHLLDQMEQTVKVAVEQGLPRELLAKIETVPSHKGIGEQVIEHNKPLIMPGLTAEAGPARQCSPENSGRYIGLPMRASGGTVGVLSLLRETTIPFNEDEIALLTSIADQLGVIVESIQLRQLAEQAAIIGERARLARNLHDSVTQLLYSAALVARAGRESYRHKNLTPMDKYLGELEDITHQALKEMRLLVYGLRPPTLEQDGLAGALQLRLETIESRVGIKTELLVDDRVELPSRAEEALFYITQEALNNTLKHALPTSVTVRIDLDNDGVTLVIRDNGTGFDPEAIGDKGGVGLVSMRERVKEFGGTLTLNSGEGQGTTVKVKLPLRPA